MYNYLLSEDLVKIFLSIFLGGILGVEREFRSKSAGFRTLILISLAATLFTMLSIELGGKANPDRIASNILTGIGFLGAGVIFKEENRVRGLTTATTIWIVSAIGMCVGLGLFKIAFTSTLLSILVLYGFAMVQTWIDSFSQIRMYTLKLPFSAEFNPEFELKTQEMNLKSLERKHLKENNQTVILWTLKGHQKNHELWAESLLKNSQIIELTY